jgi:hypothetical protein
MNLQRCLKILELESPGSFENAKKAYRDLVRVWHPDRFEGNPRLKQKAEKKLREINLAFNFLREYLAANPARKTAPSTRTKSHSLTGTRPANHAAGLTSQNTRANTYGAKPVSSVSYAGKTVPRPPSLSRFVLVALFLIAVFISALAVYFITNADNITSKARGVASETMENILDKLEQDGSVHRDKSATKGFIQDKNSDNRMAQFEIHLDSSSIIMTDLWWEEGEMIMYRVDGGTMGIERSRVKKIIKR